MLNPKNLITWLQSNLNSSPFPYIIKILKSPWGGRVKYFSMLSRWTKKCITLPSDGDQKV